MYKITLGQSVRFEDELPVINTLADRFEHTYIIGKTGMGKSSLLERIAEYDINQGLAVIVIDPKGNSCKKLAHLTQDKSRIKYISIQNPIVINPLNKEGYRLNNVIQEFIQILDVLVSLTSSNRESTVLMKEIILMAMKSITKEEHKNLDYLTKFLLYRHEREKLFKDLKPNSPEYIYWKEFDGFESKGVSKNREKLECAKRVASRLIEISSGEMRNFVIGKNELDISGIVNEGKVVLVDTSKMNRNSRIYLSNLIVYAVLSYCEFAENKVKPLMVYVDEFQIVVSDLFSDLLARSRDSKVGFTLSHQNFQQIPKDILGAIFGNVGTSICFRCGDEEAARFAPIFDIKTKDLFNLPKYHAWIRINIDDIPYNILIETYPPKLKEIPEVKVPAQKTLSFLNDDWIQS